MSKPSAGEKPLFSFVVVADTHVNEADDVSGSPCATNRLANARARHVFDDIAAMDPPPRFVFHLGDIVHPVPSLPTFADAVAAFRDIAAPLKVPLHVVPGNHDVGDKRIDWMPADQVCDKYLETYREAFGSDFFSFDDGQLRFVALNALLLNSGLADEERQKRWLETLLDDSTGRRVFMFLHYPPYVHKPDERGSYDNIDEPGRSWLLALMRRPEVEAVFAGHVHNFWYDRVGGADLYMLPSTAFLRHDLTEFYRVAPLVEFGRGDAEKFGYFVVDVYADGHVALAVRTHGQSLAPGQTVGQRRPNFLSHPSLSGFERVGVELRHPWTESMQIAATGGVQEFGRKWARNDYPLLALWEMGARLSKVTDADFLDPEARERMALLARLGHRFILTCLGLPPTVLTRESAQAAGVLAVEVNATWRTVRERSADLAERRRAAGVPVYLSKIHGFEDMHHASDGKSFSHFIKAGFMLADLQGGAETEAVRQALAEGLIDGVTVRVEADEDLGPSGLALIDAADALGVQLLASLKTSGARFADERADDDDLAVRVATAMLLSKASARVHWVFDTFMDVDRGYFPRHAFIDRRFDPRPAAHTFTALNALLSHVSTLRVESAVGGLAGRGEGAEVRLVRGTAAARRKALRSAPAQAQVYDLVSESFQPRDEALAALDQARGGSGALLIVFTP